MDFDPLRRGFAEFVGAFTLVFIGAGATLTFEKVFLTPFLQGGGSADLASGLAVVYWLAQFAAAACAAILLKWIFPMQVRNAAALGAPALGHHVTHWQGF